MHLYKLKTDFYFNVIFELVSYVILIVIPLYFETEMLDFIMFFILLIGILNIFACLS